MTLKTYKIKVMPKGKIISAVEGRTLFEILPEKNFDLSSECDGNGMCGKCRIKVLAGAGEATEGDLQHLTPEEIVQGWRQACLVVLANDMTVEICPPEE